MKYKITTLGCKVNQFETQALEGLLAEQGLLPAEEGECADVVIVNTCAVTAESGRKSRQALRRLMGENPGAVSAVCGCFSQLSPETVKELGADVIHGSGEKRRFCEDIVKALEKRETLVYTDDPFSRREFEELRGGAVDGRTRAVLKIQDGCVNFCSYCIIPYTRGRLRSLPCDRCAELTRELAAGGFREIVITGIEIASYGRDLADKPGLADAVEAICSAGGDMRVRLGSLEPTVVTEDFCRRLAATGKVCGHFHLSLQSGCDEILASMNRKYDTERFLKATKLLREYFPDCGMTADLIVGFPGETDAQHESTLNFIRRCRFSSMHIFPYSRRPGTKAADMENQVPRDVKARRAAQAQAVAEEMEREYLQSRIGRTEQVIFEFVSDELSSGHASNYAHVCVRERQPRGVVRNVKITGLEGKMLVGYVV